MRHERGVEWLNQQLPELVARGLLTEHNAEALRQHYCGQTTPNPLRLLVIITAILGASLIGSGVILLIGHNWHELSRSTRTILAFLPLVVGQALAFWSLSRGRDSPAWREASSVLTALAVAAAIALVSQIYHISGDFSAFMFTWMLLILPLIYVPHSSAVGVMYLAGIAVWSVSENRLGYSLFYWPMAAAVVPHYLSVLRENRTGPRQLWLAVAIAISLPFGLQPAVDNDLFPRAWMLGYGGLAAALYLIGALFFDQQRHPFKLVGGLGIFILTLLFSYSWPWDFSPPRRDAIATAEDYCAVAIHLLMLAAAFALLAACILRRKKFSLTAGLLPVVIGAGFLLLFTAKNPLLVAVLVNFYGLALGVMTLRAGIVSTNLADVNAGMLIIAALIVARFADADMDLLARGITFIFIGVLFLIVNFLVVRRRKQLAL